MGSPIVVQIARLRLGMIVPVRGVGANSLVWPSVNQRVFCLDGAGAGLAPGTFFFGHCAKFEENPAKADVRIC